MEIKINRDIREYTEKVYFGLSLRQFICSLCACAVGVFIYLISSPYWGVEIRSWICILCAAPFAAIGFVKYNGMSAEKLAWAWIKSEILTPKHLEFKPENLYYEIIKDKLKEYEKETFLKDENTES
ncbi:MAG: PrgI family protein [Oscillospiraceae bacterium]